MIEVRHRSRQIQCELMIFGRRFEFLAVDFELTENRLIKGDRYSRSGGRGAIEMKSRIFLACALVTDFIVPKSEGDVF